MKKKEAHSRLAEEMRKADISEEKRRLALKNVREKLEKERTMSLSIKEGSFASVMYSLFDSYIIPFALILNANNLHIGLLRSFSGLLPPITQLYGSKLMQRYSRRRLIISYVSLQALMILPILVLALFFWKSLFASYLPYFLILFYTLYAVVGAIATPAWFSLMGDIVPENIRGRYFGKRNRITGAVALISTVTAAFLLDIFKTRGLVLAGFSILFLVAMIARLISAYLFKKHHNPKFRQQKKVYFSFTSFIKKIPKYNFSKFALFVSVMHFAVMIAGPFFAVYMLKELGFSYTTYMIIILSESLAALLMMPFWGKFSDKYGRKITLTICSVFIAIMPALWLISQSPYYLVFPMIIAGIGWAGFNLSAFNFIYDSVSVQRRGLCLAYYNILLGIGIFIGAGLGGLILQKLPGLNLNFSSFFIIFLISSSLRLLSSIIFLPMIKEPRKVRKFHPILSFRSLGITNKVGHHLVHDLHTAEEKIKNGTKIIFGH